MKKILNTLIMGAYTLSIFMGLVVLSPQVTLANDGEDHDEVTTQQVDAKKVATYNYTAQPGDSYSQMARKAIQTYGIKNKTKLSRAKIIAAETWMTQEAESPLLEVGQKVSVQETAVKGFVDKVLKLSASEESAWAVYVAGVDFNTNSVGQSK